ncbi:hypothetical protein [Leuconostoc pseudomesenteroides]|uniref:hypothetical protein n=1 Tax=Leuconostoc pseudomesenteroides TaxID=33968 RepID=UPI00345E5B17
MKGIIFLVVAFIVQLISIISFILNKSFGIDLYLSYLIVGYSTLAIGMLFVWMNKKE